MLTKGATYYATEGEYDCYRVLGVYRAERDVTWDEWDEMAKASSHKATYRGQVNEVLLQEAVALGWMARIEAEELDL